jgi:hypothetical protein
VSAARRFFVLCPECALADVHNDLAAAQRLARGHGHAGVAVIGVCEIASAGERRAATRIHGMILAHHGTPAAAGSRPPTPPTGRGRQAAGAAPAGAA